MKNYKKNNKKLNVNSPLKKINLKNGRKLQSQIKTNRELRTNLIPYSTPSEKKPYIGDNANTCITTSIITNIHHISLYINEVEGSTFKVHYVLTDKL